MKEQEQQYLDFNFLSDNGLIYEINKKVLHKYGLALARYTDGSSPGVLVDTKDFKFEYSDNVSVKNIEKVKTFESKYIDIIKEKLESTK